MEGHDGEGNEYVEVSVPTQLVMRVVNAIIDVMVEWERERTEAGEDFDALIGNAAAHVAVDFLDTMTLAVPEPKQETMQ